jgi:putative oxidoreductase
VSTQAHDHQPRRRPAGELAETAWARWCAIDRCVIAVLGRISLPALRGSLGVVFGWFGILKLAAVSPVADLVTAVLDVAWIDPSWAVPALGVTEVTVGLGLLTGRGLRVVLALCSAQLLGTFLVLAIRPEVAFQGGNPLLLTMEGEFVLKNLVLLSAGLAVGARLRTPRPWSATPSPGHDRPPAA